MIPNRAVQPRCAVSATTQNAGTVPRPCSGAPVTVRYASLFFHVFANEDSTLLSAVSRVGRFQIAMQE